MSLAEWKYKPTVLFLKGDFWHLVSVKHSCCLSPASLGNKALLQSSWAPPTPPPDGPLPAITSWCCLSFLLFKLWAVKKFHEDSVLFCWCRHSCREVLYSSQSSFENSNTQILIPSSLMHLTNLKSQNSGFLSIAQSWYLARPLQPAVA